MAIRITQATDATPDGAVDLTADTFVVVTIPGTVTAFGTLAVQEGKAGKTLGVGNDPLILIPEGDLAAIDVILTADPWDSSDKLWCALKKVMRSKIDDWQQG